MRDGSSDCIASVTGARASQKNREKHNHMFFMHNHENVSLEIRLQCAANCCKIRKRLRDDCVHGMPPLRAFLRKNVSVRSAFYSREEATSRRSCPSSAGTTFRARRMQACRSQRSPHTPRRMVRQSVKMLLDHMKRRENHMIQNIRVTCRLIVRDTTARVQGEEAFDTITMNRSASRGG